MPGLAENSCISYKHGVPGQSHGNISTLFIQKKFLIEHIRFWFAIILACPLIILPCPLLKYTYTFFALAPQLALWLVYTKFIFSAIVKKAVSLKETLSNPFLEPTSTEQSV